MDEQEVRSATTTERERTLIPLRDTPPELSPCTLGLATYTFGTAAALGSTPPSAPASPNAEHSILKKSTLQNTERSPRFLKLPCLSSEETLPPTSSGKRRASFVALAEAMSHSEDPRELITLLSNCKDEVTHDGSSYDNATESLRDIIQQRDDQILLCVDMGQQLLKNLNEKTAEWERKDRQMAMHLDSVGAELQRHRVMVGILEGVAKERDALAVKAINTSSRLEVLENDQWMSRHAAAKLENVQKKEEELELAFSASQSILKDHSAVLDDTKMMQLAFFENALAMASEWLADRHEAACDFEALLASVRYEHNAMTFHVICEMETLSVSEQRCRATLEGAWGFVFETAAEMFKTVTPSYSIIQLRHLVRAKDAELVSLRPLMGEVESLRKVATHHEYRAKCLEIDRFAERRHSQAASCEHCVDYLATALAARSELSDAVAREQSVWDRVREVEGQLLSAPRKEEKSVVVTVVPRAPTPDPPPPPPPHEETNTVTRTEELRLQLSDATAVSLLVNTECAKLREELLRTKFFSDTRAHLVQCVGLIQQSVKGTVGTMRVWANAPKGAVTQRHVRDAFHEQERLYTAIKETVTTCLTKDECRWAGIIR